VRDFNGMRRPARAYVVVAAQFATPASKPLGSWASLRVFAPGWGTPACIATSPGGGCSHYQGLLTVRSPLARVIPAVQARLAGWGLAVTTSHCAMAAKHPGCIFAAMKFRGLGGRDPVYVDVVIATRSTPELTVVGVNLAS
jgi:hypothetical protein